MIPISLRRVRGGQASRAQNVFGWRHLRAHASEEWLGRVGLVDFWFVSPDLGLVGRAKTEDVRAV